MNTQHETHHVGEFLLSEAHGTRSRETGVINATAGKLVSGTVLSKITAANAAKVTAQATNVGNGALGVVTVNNHAVTGNYQVEITGEAANAGAFLVTNPHGEQVGTGKVGVAFAGGGLKFTLADGAKDFKIGDKWSVAVTAGIGEWVPYDDHGSNDGRRTAGGILYNNVDASKTDCRATIIVRDAEVATARLIGLDHAGQVDLAALGIVTRG